jgi:hypothetical protein
MSRRDEWRKVLDAELRRWSAKPADELIAELRDIQVYEVELDSKTYQVEIQVLQNTNEYVQVMVSVDDGSLPASISPATEIFVCRK